MGVGRLSSVWTRWERWLGADSTESQLNHARKQIAHLSREAEKYKAFTYGALTEQENLRKRLQQQLGGERVFHVSHCAKDFLEVADNLSRVLSQLPPSAKTDPQQALAALNTVLDAAAMTQSSMQSALKKWEVAEFAPLGEQFDEKRHELAPGSAAGGCVAVVHSPGYTLRHIVLRRASVSLTPQKPT